MNPLPIAVEGIKVISLGSVNLANVLGLLVACYFVFNTMYMYPTKCGNVFLFL